MSEKVCEYDGVPRPLLALRRYRAPSTPCRASRVAYNRNNLKGTSVFCVHRSHYLWCYNGLKAGTGRRLFRHGSTDREKEMSQPTLMAFGWMTRWWWETFTLLHVPPSFPSSLPPSIPHENATLLLPPSVRSSLRSPASPTGTQNWWRKVRKKLLNCYTESDEAAPGDNPNTVILKTKKKMKEKTRRDSADDSANFLTPKAYEQREKIRMEMKTEENGDWLCKRLLNLLTREPRNQKKTEKWHGDGVIKSLPQQIQ